MREEDARVIQKQSCRSIVEAGPTSLENFWAYTSLMRDVPDGPVKSLILVARYLGVSGASTRSWNDSTLTWDTSAWTPVTLARPSVLWPWARFPTSTVESNINHGPCWEYNEDLPTHYTPVLNPVLWIHNSWPLPLIAVVVDHSPTVGISSP